MLEFLHALGIFWLTYHDLPVFMAGSVGMPETWRTVHFFMISPHPRDSEWNPNAGDAPEHKGGWILRANRQQTHHHLLRGPGAFERL